MGGLVARGAPSARQAISYLTLLAAVCTSYSTAESALPLSAQQLSPPLQLHQLRSKRERLLQSLVELTDSPANLTCPPSLRGMVDKIVVQPTDPDESRKIPRIIHVSHKSRCVSKKLAWGLRNWQAMLPQHSFFFHDDAAVRKLLYGDWPEFPHLAKILRCFDLMPTVAKIDVWRLLLMYKYGGIYTDADNDIRPWLNESLITPDDEAIFLYDSHDNPSQWFFAMEPMHPIANLTVLTILNNIMRLKFPMTKRKPSVLQITGPLALARGFEKFAGKTLDQMRTKYRDGLRGYKKERYSKYAAKNLTQERTIYQGGHDVRDELGRHIRKRARILELADKYVVTSPGFKFKAAKNATMNMRARIHNEMNTVYWKDEFENIKLRWEREGRPKNCREFLRRDALRRTQMAV